MSKLGVVRGTLLFFLGALSSGITAEERTFPLTAEDSVRSVVVYGVKQAHAWKFNPMKDARLAAEGHHIVVVSYSRKAVEPGRELPPVELALLDSQNRQGRSLPEVMITAGRSWRGFEIPDGAIPQRLVVDNLVFNLSAAKLDATIHKEVGIGEP